MSAHSRTPGLSRFQTSSARSNIYATHGATLRSTHKASLEAQLSVFQSLVHNFALEHSSQIQQDPTFRAQFTKICNSVGVDPLAGTVGKGQGQGGGTKDGDGGKPEKEKGWWAKLASGNGKDTNVSYKEDKTFKCELATRLVELCRATRAENGGLLGVREARAAIAKGRGIGGEMHNLTDEDIVNSVSFLSPLGPGFSILTVGEKDYIRSVPQELSQDASTVLALVQVFEGHLSVSKVVEVLGWERARTVLEDLVMESVLWVDDQEVEREYWSPAWMGGEE